MESNDDSNGLKRTLLHTRGFFILALCLGTFLMLVNQSLSFSALIGWIGDWQFARFGRYYPALTVFLLISMVLFISVTLARFGRYLWRRGEATVSANTRRLITLADASRLLFIVGALAGFATLTVFAHYRQLPDNSGKLEVIRLPMKGSVALREGPLMLIDAPGIGPIARYSEGIIFTQRTSYLMPVARAVVTGDAAGVYGPYNLFVEVDLPLGSGDDFSLVELARNQGDRHQGHFRVNGLRPEIVQMYRSAGYSVDDQSSVLYLSTASANFGTLVFMIELLIFGIISVIFGIIMRRADVSLRKKTTGNN